MSPDVNASAPPPDEGQATPTSPSTSVAAPDATSQAPRNLHDDPNVRRLQSQYERQMAELRKQQAAAQDELNKLKMAGMDDVERLAYERDQLRQELEQVRGQREAEEAKRKVLTELSELSGIPVSEIADSEDLYDAARRTILRLKGTREERQAASVVDLGGGRASTPSDRQELAAREAMKNRDPVAYMRSLRQA